LQKLHDNDRHLRLTFCRDEIARIINDRDHMSNLFHSDEANFHVSGAVNKQNFRYWSPENPGWASEEPLHSPKVVVWAAISAKRVIGPVFFDDVVNGERYLAMLQTQLWPQLNRTERNITRFMLDGAPPHWARNVRQWLTEKFPNRWMGRGSPNMPWPPRSPDLSMCDFFLWGYLKSVVYRNKLETLCELKAAIVEAFNTVTMDFLQKSALDYRRRLEKCTRLKGGHVEMEVVNMF
jgi:hypothetical protein